METLSKIKEKILQEGFVVIDNVFSGEEIETIVSTIAKADAEKPTFRRTNDLFAIRQFLKEVPASADLLFSTAFIKMISDLFDDDYFVVKSIYFDKPPQSNWFVSYHQDLTISVDRKIDTEGFQNWTVKQNQFAVQPPLTILEDNFTVRIHLDDTNEDNGALKVIPKSHRKGIFRPETIDWTVDKETVCNVSKGGAMIMKPLLLHSSSRTINNNRRRVIHLEFSRCSLPDGLNWAEVAES